jgi:glucose-6-phosphate dehydrogenase assembly protein OpcA
MPTNTYKVLGQSAPSATTLTDVYTVPASRSTVLSTITVANRAATSAAYRIAIRPAGASIANQHYIAYDVVIAANDTTALTLGITLATTDVVSVYGSTANFSFNVFGSEITP